jgi:hypothetical protein
MYGSSVGDSGDWRHGESIDCDERGWQMGVSNDVVQVLRELGEVNSAKTMLLQLQHFLHFHPQQTKKQVNKFCGKIS